MGNAEAENKHIVVVGGSIAGLAAAFILSFCAALIAWKSTPGVTNPSPFDCLKKLSTFSWR